MTPTEYAALCDTVEDHWPATRSWDNADRIYHQYADYELSVATKAIDILFREGRQSSPSPSVLLAEVRRLSVLEGPRPGRHECKMIGHENPTWRRRLYHQPEWMGPGLLRCISDTPRCTEHRACHCDECHADPAYAPVESRTR